MTLSTKLGEKKAGREGKEKMVVDVPPTYKMTFPLLSSSSEEEEEEVLDLDRVVVAEKEEDLPAGVGGINRKKTLTRQLSAKETTLEAKWEKRRRQILDRRRRMAAVLSTTAQGGAGCCDVGEAAAAAGEAAADAEEEERKLARARVRSLTDEDLDELRGSIDLGFGFNEEDGGHSLRDTLPALDLYFAVNRQLSDPKLQCSPSPDGTPTTTATSSSSNLCATPSPRSPRDQELDSWKICSPGDKPQDVKVRLRQWAQIVACSVRQCRQCI